MASLPFLRSQVARRGAGIDAVWRHRAATGGPILIVHGDRDPIAPPAASRDLAASLPSSDRTVTILPGVEHDVLGGAGAGASEVQAWLDARVAGPQAAAAMPAGRLRGDAISSTAGLRLAAGFVRSSDGEYEEAHSIRAGLSYGGPIGWFGALSYDTHRIMAYPLGVALRLGQGGQLALAVGAGVDDPLVADLDLSTGATASLDLPVGRWLALSSTVDAGWRWLDGDERSFDLRARTGVRIAPVRQLGRASHGAMGLVLSAIYERRFGDDFVGLGIACDLFGSR